MNAKQDLTYANLEDLNDPQKIIDTYFLGLVMRNPAKYASYVFAMKRVVPFILRLPWTIKNAHKLLPITYAVCRIVDDYIDGDFKDVQDRPKVPYVEARIAFLNACIWDNCPEQKTPEDKLFGYMFSLISDETETKRLQLATSKIVESMLFDAKRIEAYKKTGKLEFPLARNLLDHFVLMDVNGTGGGLSALIHLWDDTADIVRTVGIACRIEYSLEDLPEDIRAGIVNISRLLPRRK